MTDVAPVSTITPVDVRADFPTARLFGLDFFVGQRAALVDALVGAPTDAMRLVVTCNLDHLYLLENDAEFDRAYRGAWVATVDSRPMRVAAKLLYGIEPPLITGSDLFPELLDRLDPAQHRAFFVCSEQIVADRLVTHMAARGFGADAIGTAVPPFGFERDETLTATLVEAITRVAPTHLFMGVGAPKSEKWVLRHRDALPPAYVFGLGASLDFVAGVKQRAPVWVQRMGMEWAHRMVQEPGRLVGRYARDGVAFTRRVRRTIAEDRRGNRVNTG